MNFSVSQLAIMLLGFSEVLIGITNLYVINYSPMCTMLDEGHSINKLQSGFFLVISKYENVKYVFC